MAGIGGTGTSNRSWFAQTIGDACVSLGISTDDDEIAGALAEFLWWDLYRSPVTMGFWNDVALAQGLKRAIKVCRLTDHVSLAPFNAPPDLE